jgi:hypothetical protein
VLHQTLFKEEEDEEATFFGLPPLFVPRVAICHHFNFSFQLHTLPEGINERGREGGEEVCDDDDVRNI